MGYVDEVVGCCEQLNLNTQVQSVCSLLQKKRCCLGVQAVVGFSSVVCHQQPLGCRWRGLEFQMLSISARDRSIMSLAQWSDEKSVMYASMSLKGEVTCEGATTVKDAVILIEAGYQ